MRIVIFTNEYPPHVYGGAGVHVEYPDARTSQHWKIIRSPYKSCVSAINGVRDGNLIVEGVTPHVSPPTHDPRHQKFLETMVRDIVMAGSVREADIVHCHTWYSHLAGMPPEAAARRPAGIHHPLAGAAPSLEGRTTRHRLSRQLLGRAHRLPERRWRRSPSPKR